MGAIGGYEHPHVVPETLDELTGPTSGDVVLPVRLDWGPERIYHLADAQDLQLVYERVIREALRIDDLRAFLNGVVLRRIWADLFLPTKLRRQWEARFPGLNARSA